MRWIPRPAAWPPSWITSSWTRSTPPGTSPTTASVRADAEPYEARGHGADRGTGVLLLHGFTGSPRSMRPWAEHLAAEGFTVSVPRLPGHGTVWTELERTDWTDWYAGAERELRRLSRTCSTVVVAGLSMGGGLALRLAECHPDRVAGVVLVNPAIASDDWRMRALPVLKGLVRSLPGIANDVAKPGVDEGGYDRTPLAAAHSMTRLWREVQRGLGRVQQPLLLFRSVTDHVVDPSSGEKILALAGSTDVQERLLERSYHVATVDYDAEEIFAGTVAFVRRLTRG